MKNVIWVIFSNLNLLVLNFSSCELGKSLVTQLAQKSQGNKIIAVAKNAQEFKGDYSDTVELFEADNVNNEDIGKIN